MFYLKTDPGPCPVDDCPHHSCVGAEASPSSGLTSVQLPARDGARQPRSRLTMGTVPGALTTGTYRRAVWLELAARAAERQP